MGLGKMDLWNENQISHMNLLTSSVFLLPVAMMKTRFSDICTLAPLWNGKQVVIVTGRDRSLPKEGGKKKTCTNPRILCISIVNSLL